MLLPNSQVYKYPKQNLDLQEKTKILEKKLPKNLHYLFFLYKVILFFSLFLQLFDCHTIKGRGIVSLTKLVSEEDLVLLLRFRTVRSYTTMVSSQAKFLLFFYRFNSVSRTFGTS